MIFLTEQERASLKTQHKQEHDGRVRDRIKAILLYDEGWSSQQIARVLLISDQNDCMDITGEINAKTQSRQDAEKIENILAAQVIDAAIEVHRTLGGPGLLESL